MYTSSGLLLLIFISIVQGDHGDPNQCCVGGIIESDCQKLIDESVLQTYISKFETTKRDVKYDKLYRHFKYPGFAVPTIFKNNPEPLFHMTGLYLKQLHFKFQNYHLLSLRQIFAIGTDIYKVKHYSSLSKNPNWTPSEHSVDNIVYLSSCYNAATTYYFTRNYAIAINVALDGIQFIDLLCKTDGQKNRRVLSVFYILYYTLMIDIMNNLPDTQILKITLLTKEQILKNIIAEENLLDEMVNGTKYPYYYILMYRQYFLNKDLSPGRKEKLENTVKNNLLTYHKNFDNVQLFTKMFSIYFELVKASIEPNKIYAFKLLTKAIFSPVNSTEARLLNYQANQMAKKTVKDCIDENGWIAASENTLCKELDSMRNSDEELRANDKTVLDSMSANNFGRVIKIVSKSFVLNADSMLTKYAQEKMYTNIIEKFKANVKNDDTINENILHIIVTGAIDMDSGIREQKIETVKQGIAILDEYVSESMVFEHVDKSKINQNRFSKMQVTKYMVAYKWLAELYAVLCTGTLTETEENSIYENGVMDSLKKAILISKNIYNKQNKNIDRIDIHLKYLRTKFNCKVEFNIQSWESRTRIGGWVTKTPDSDLPALIIDGKKEPDCPSQFQSFLTVNHPYIHKSDVLINYYRCLVKSTYDSYENIIWSGYVKRAMSIPVISAEDRCRNNEAHELYSMHLLKFNSLPKYLSDSEREKILEDLYIFNF